MNNIEFEYKLLITQKQYEKLNKYLQKEYKSNTYNQSNTYFDTLEKDLYFSNSALRIREKDDTLEYTYKSKISELKKLEIKEMTDNIILSNMPSKIKDILITRNININDLLPFTKIDTKRIDYLFYHSLLSLDITTFNNNEYDFELELEVENKEDIKFFKQLLTTFNIEYKQSKSKVERSLEYLNK